MVKVRLHTGALGPWKEVVEQVRREDAHLALDAVVEQQPRRNGRPVGASSPPPLARMDSAVLHLHSLQTLQAKDKVPHRSARYQTVAAQCK